MTPALSLNTQAILLLTAPLIAGRGVATPDLLTPGEYKRLARHLRDIQRQPSDLLSADAAEVMSACQSVVDEVRLAHLLGRGFLLSQVVERWQARAIWVVSRADPEYPRRLKMHLREDAPAILYGCGDLGLLDTGGLAVVGSRDASDDLIEYTQSVGKMAAKAGRAIVSGGARGIDQAAMRGALEAGGYVCGVLADSLEKTAMTREHRNFLLEGQLVLLSPFDPSAGFNVGNAMQRNKLIYALADASLVVNSDVKKGGTRAGAIEQLDKYHFVPVFVRSTGEPSAGLEALQKKGALPWPNPLDEEGFADIFRLEVAPTDTSPQSGPLLNEQPLAAPDVPVVEVVAHSEPKALSEAETLIPVVPVQATAPLAAVEEIQVPLQDVDVPGETAGEAVEGELPPAEIVFQAARSVILRVLVVPLKEAEVAEELGVTVVQAKAWLQRLLEEGEIEKQKKPAGYVIRQKGLF